MIIVLDEICKQNSCKAFNWASDLEQRNKLWLARHHIWFAMKAQNPNRKVNKSLLIKFKMYVKYVLLKINISKAISTDVCVPISNLPEILLRSQEEVKKYNLKTMVVGHVGDGNFHTFVSIDTNNQEQVKNFQNYSKSLVDHALSLEGTCTGEHGIGIGSIFIILVKIFF